MTESRAEQNPFALRVRRDKEQIWEAKASFPRLVLVL